MTNNRHLHLNACLIISPVIYHKVVIPESGIYDNGTISMHALLRIIDDLFCPGAAFF